MPDFTMLSIDGSDRVPPQAGPPILSGTKSRPRLIAMAVDNVLAGILAFVLSAKLPLPNDAVRDIVLLTLYLAYYLVPEAIWGRTPGKRLCHLLIRRVDGCAAGWKESAIRTAARVVEVNPFLFGALPGALAVAWSQRHQRFGDMLARTVVTRDA